MHNSRAKDGLTRNEVRTYVFLSGWTATPLGVVVLGEISFERSEEITVDTVVEKCLEDGIRERGEADVGVDVEGELVCDRLALD